MKTSDEIINYIGKAEFDEGSGIIFAKNGDDLQHLLDIRGWGHIQNMFKTQQEAADFQDSIGRFIQDAINDKIALSKALPEEGINLVEVEKVVQIYGNYMESYMKSNKKECVQAARQAINYTLEDLPKP